MKNTSNVECRLRSERKRETQQRHCRDSHRLRLNCNVRAVSYHFLTMEELISLLFAKTADSTLLNPKKAMNISLVTQLGVASCFCLTSVFLRHFSVVGFQLLVTGLLNILFAAGSFWIINKQPDSLSVGACLGSGVVISILSLTTAVYWGELSRCEILSVAVRKYTCDSKDAMRVLCVFSVLLFLLQVSLEAT